MGVYECTFYESDYVKISKESECEKNEIALLLFADGEGNTVYLNYEQCQEIVNELNHLLTEGKGNE